MAEKKTGTSDNKKRGKKPNDLFQIVANGDLQPQLTAAHVEIRRLRKVVEQVRRTVC